MAGIRYKVHAKIFIFFFCFFVVGGGRNGKDLVEHATGGGELHLPENALPTVVTCNLRNQSTVLCTIIIIYRSLSYQRLYQGHEWREKRPLKISGCLALSHGPATARKTAQKHGCSVSDRIEIEAYLNQAQTQCTRPNREIRDRPTWVVFFDLLGSSSLVAGRCYPPGSCKRTDWESRRRHRLLAVSLSEPPRVAPKPMRRMSNVRQPITRERPRRRTGFRQPNKHIRQTTVIME